MYIDNGFLGIFLLFVFVVALEWNNREGIDWSNKEEVKEWNNRGKAMARLITYVSGLSLLYLFYQALK